MHDEDFMYYHPLIFSFYDFISSFGLLIQIPLPFLTTFRLHFKRHGRLWWLASTTLTASIPACKVFLLFPTFPFVNTTRGTVGIIQMIVWQMVNCPLLSPVNNISITLVRIFKNIKPWKSTNLPREPYVFFREPANSGAISELQCLSGLFFLRRPCIFQIWISERILKNVKEQGGKSIIKKIYIWPSEVMKVQIKMLQAKFC